MHEAAEITGIGQAAFKSRLHQARLRARAADGGQALVTAGGSAGSRAIGRATGAVHKRAGTPRGERICRRGDS